MAPDDSASTSLVLHREGFSALGAPRRYANGRIGASVETCAAVPHRVSACAHNRLETDPHAGKHFGRTRELVRCNEGRVLPRSIAVTERLSFAQIVILCAYAFGMA